MIVSLRRRDHVQQLAAPDEPGQPRGATVTLIHNTVGTPQAARLLLLVHGYGADERDLGGVLPYLDPEGRFLTVLPRGPVAAPPGFGWYDIDDRTSAAAEAAFTSSLDELDALLDRASDEHGLDRAGAVVAGFSQGGGLALALALRRSARPHPAAVLALSPALPSAELLDRLPPDWDAAQSIPFLVQHGSQDPLVPVERSRDLAQRLDARGVPITYTEYPMGHQVALESLQQAHEWLLAVQSGETPRQPLPEPPPEPLVRPVTSASFEAEVLRSELPVIVDFWAPWCGPCRQVSPVVEQIAAMRKGSYKVVKINIDEEPSIAQHFQVQSIPLIGLFRNGRLERSATGAKPRQQIEAELGMIVIP